MKLAWLFPGQGFEQPGMGLDLLLGSSTGRHLLAFTGEVLGTQVRPLLAQGGTLLYRTEVLQPVLTAVCLASLAALSAAGVQPTWLAGHALGELAAWAAAGGITPEQAIALAARRGQLMARAIQKQPGGMLALPTTDRAMVRAALRLGRRHGQLVVAALNAPAQWVLSGEVAALHAVQQAFDTRPLNAAGPWNSPALASALPAWRTTLQQVPSAPWLHTPVCCDGALITDAEHLRERLAQQLVRPVRWARTMAVLGCAGVEAFVTVGPSKILRGLVRANLGSRPLVYGTFDTADVARTCTALAPSPAADYSDGVLELATPDPGT